jgi:hypothetical protein
MWKMRTDVWRRGVEERKGGMVAPQEARLIWTGVSAKHWMHVLLDTLKVLPTGGPYAK